MGLRLRLILVVLVPLVLVVGIYGLFRVRREQADLLDENQRNVALAAKGIQSAVENALRDWQISDIKRLLSEIVVQDEQIDRIRVFNARLKPTVVSNPLVIGEEVPTSALQRAVETGQPEGFYQQRGPQFVFYYLVPLRGRGGQGAGAMEIVQLASAVTRRVQAATWDVVVRLSVLVAIAVLAGIMLQRQVLRPLFRLMEGIRSVGLGQPGARLPVERRDELGRVAEAFNTMAEQLETARVKLVAETERTVDLQQQLRHAETLGVAGKLATGLAHEIGTPLNIISARAEFLMHTLSTDDRRREELAIIIAQIDRISGIIRSLLDMVRPAKPDIQPAALPGAVERLLPLLRHAARRHGVALDAALPGDLPPILVDPNQLQQVLINLIMNAVQAAEPGGKVWLTAARSGDGDRPGVAVSVRDTGSGIPPEILPRIFEPFFTTKPAGQGTGLGLAICRDIIKEHGGEIRVDSQPGRGTTVTVWLAEAAASES
jgi:two-component system NtrC family sensor kinase